MKALSLLVLLFLATPGSGQLIWDGLPFSTRTEFLGLILTVVVLSSRETRTELRTTLNRLRWRSLLAPVLLILCVVKLFTFALSPLSSGFGACYRSIYEPLEEVTSCEKSYEGPFLQGHGLPTARVSRVDSAVDFGRQMYDWRLPFMNESQRFQRLWLSRFPFTASYNFQVQNKSGKQEYLPLYAIGKLNVSIGGRSVVRAENYDRHFLAAVRLPEGESKILVTYQYADLVTSELPDTAPPPRGPYARLKIGKPQSLEQLLSQAQILILVNTDLDSKIQLSDLEVRNRLGQPVTLEREVTAQGNDNEGLATSPGPEFEITLDRDALSTGPLRLVHLVNGRAITLATIRGDSSYPFNVQAQEHVRDGVRVRAVLTNDQDSLVPYQPGPITEIPVSLRLLLIAMDVISLAIVVAFLFALLRALQVDFAKTALLAAISWIAVNPFYNLLPPILGGGRELVIPYLLIAPLVVLFRNQISRFPLGVAGPLALVLASQKIFDHLYFNHPGEGEHWWGKLIFMWRDSDWYVNHGNARLVFVDGFLRGGESVFYARTGPRYLIFAGQFLLGENDILIGSIALTAGFLTIFYLVSQFAVSHESNLSHVTAMIITFIGMILLGDQIITAFGFLVTSEYTTWVGLLGITCFLLKPTTESRTWVATSIVGLSALLVHFRPNILFVSLTLIVVVLLRINRSREVQAARQVVWSIAVVVTILPVSLIHNLYYGGRFVPFTENSAETVAIHKRFSWIGVWSELGIRRALELIWEQTRTIMYWTPPNDPNLAIAFWGSQMALVVALARRSKRGRLCRAQSLLALLPVSYIGPMVSYNLTSYYPRHIVTASLLCLCSAVLIWPKSSQQTDAVRYDYSLRSKLELQHELSRSVGSQSSAG